MLSGPTVRVMPQPALPVPYAKAGSPQATLAPQADQMGREQFDARMRSAGYGKLLGGLGPFAREVQALKIPCYRDDVGNCLWVKGDDMGWLDACRWFHLDNEEVVILRRLHADADLQRAADIVLRMLPEGFRYEHGASTIAKTVAIDASILRAIIRWCIDDRAYAASLIAATLLGGLDAGRDFVHARLRAHAAVAGVAASVRR